MSSIKPATLSKFDRYYLSIKTNRWYWYFYILCRFSLAIGFFIAGMVKIMDERFASGLSELQPMGAYLEALHHTGYYYTFIGVAQVVAALLLLIPRTVTLGALLYFPIIVNIFILSYALRFDGSYVSAPLMILANLYILIWNYDKIRYLLPLKNFGTYGIIKRPKTYSNQFPIGFFLAVASTFALILLTFLYGHEIMPKNSYAECAKQFIGTTTEEIGIQFCECIHKDGNSLDDCLELYETKKN